MGISCLCIRRAEDEKTGTVLVMMKFSNREWYFWNRGLNNEIITLWLSAEQPPPASLLSCNWRVHSLPLLYTGDLFLFVWLFSLHPFFFYTFPFFSFPLSLSPAAHLAPSSAPMGCISLLEILRTKEGEGSSCHCCLNALLKLSMPWFPHL